jgi:hypothetical protein
MDGGRRGESEEEMAYAEEGGAEAQAVTMVMSTMLTTTAMLANSATATVTAKGTSIQRKNETGVAGPNVSSDPTPLRQVR